MGTPTPQHRRERSPATAPTGRRRPQAEVPELIAAAAPSAGARRTATGLLLRFICCGLLALTFGGVWRLTLAPAVIAPSSAFSGIFALLLGFIAGGILWYLHDARRRQAIPDSVSDERLVFSFIVFAVMPLAVLVLVGLVWLMTFAIGRL